MGNQNDQIRQRREPLAHPRRPPANRSVSLLHYSKGQRARTSPPEGSPRVSPQLSDREKRASSLDLSSSSPSSLKPLIGKDDSGESSNADKWFEKSNNHASVASRGFVDNDPPFFLQQSSSSETPPDGNGRPTLNPNREGSSEYPSHGGSLLLKTGLLHLGTDNSSTDDFRSVIDDLTVENKKLKRKLRTFQKLHDSHLKDQKLFEVRVHGLPATKKRELEDMLRKFAMDLNQIPTGTPSNLYEGLVPGINAAPDLKKSASSQTSNQFGDSAYASASASGQGSTGMSNVDGKRKQPSLAASQAARFRHQNIHSYLHDIPQGLMPKDPTSMTEKSKRKMVVLRLEQIFAGKGAATGGHQQPLQQQEVSQLAAKADRSAIEARGLRAAAEGMREALIMAGSEEAIDSKDYEPKTRVDTNQTRNPTIKIEDQDHDRSATAPEQRPTRPLDLDPHRAQVPAENLQYLNHLGFSPPDAAYMQAPEDGHGWIYLNLLINMAQLHTINVTTDFIKKAITDHSKKLELSSDGRKVRWKGGRSVTRTSSDGDNSPSVGGTGTSGSSNLESPRKRMKLNNGGSSGSSGNPQSLRAGQTERQDRKLVYTPLFYHRNSNDESDDSSSEEEETQDSSLPMRPMAGDSSGMTSSGIKTTSTKMKKQDSGPIIFYNNARFCTDLSGDVKTDEAMMFNPILYHQATSQTVGVSPPTLVKKASSASSDERGPLNQAKDLPEAMEIDDNPIPAEMELNFEPKTPMSTRHANDSKSFNFEASGIGGVHPADNFSVDVQSRQMHIKNQNTSSKPIQNNKNRYASRVSSILEESRAQRNAKAAVREEVMSVTHQQLPPSDLPPPSHFMAVDESEEDSDESESEDEMSIGPDSGDALAPAAAPQPIEADYASTDESEDGDDEEDEEDDESEGSDGSLDLLATAREIDPEAIRRRELEYDANMADRLAEEIPAGSSAATAGGGSGFASPSSGMDMVEYEKAKKAYKEARAAGLIKSGSKQTQTTASSTRVNQDEEDEDDD